MVLKIIKNLIKANHYITVMPIMISKFFEPNSIKIVFPQKNIFKDKKVISIN